MDARYTLSRERWAEFMGCYWGRKPLLLKSPFPPGFATTAEAFKCLVEASNSFRAGDRNIPLQFFDERAFQLTGAAMSAYLPESGDDDAASYAERVSEKMKGARFALILNGGFVGRDLQLWLRMREFLGELFRHVPPHLSYPGIFFGNYGSTPFGVHQDSVSTFQFILRGRKVMHLWPDEFARANERLRRSLDYRPFLSDAVTLEGCAGDLFYWPSAYWHVGECVEGLSLCLSIGLKPAPAPAVEVWEHMNKAVGERLKDAARTARGDFDYGGTPQSAEAVVSAVESVTAVLREVEQEPGVARAATLSILNRLTGFGFNDVPPPSAETKLCDDDLVCGFPRYPIAWARASGREVLFSANGHSFSTPVDSGILTLVERLNSGVPLGVGRLVEEHVGVTRSDETTFVATPEGIRALLETLHGLRAITRYQSEQLLPGE